MKRLRNFMIALAALTMLLAIAACGSSPENLSVETSPQLTYVHGQTLNLSGGTLRIDGKEQIAMDSPEVAVSGYDPEKLGEQEITLTYRGVSTTLTVTVVERFVPNQVITDYFVGEAFDQSRGFFTVTRDDGTSVSVKVGDQSLTIGTLDSSSAGTVSVSLSYEGYTGAFDVTVYEAATTELQLPKTYYKSHEPLSVDAGVLILKSGDGKLVRRIPLTPEMVSGYHPEEATEANAESPLAQTLTVRYGKTETHYTVYITYSGVSLIHDRYQKLPASGTIEPALAAEIFEAMEVYFNLSAEDKTLIGAEELGALVTISALYGRQLWFEEYEKIDDVVLIDAFGEYHVVGKTYEETLRAYEQLQDPANPMRQVSGTLIRIAEAFGDFEIGEGVPVSAYLGEVVTLSDFSELFRKMEFMFEFYNAAKELPQGATIKELREKYADKVEIVASLVTTSTYGRAGDRDVYSGAASWHDENLFPLLFEYYRNDPERLSALAAKQLPGALEELYSDILYAMDELSYLLYAPELGESQGIVVDSTLFMFYYTEGERIASEIREGENKIYSTYLKALPVNGSTLEEYLASLNVYGYASVMGATRGKGDAEKFWQDYLYMVGEYLEQGDRYLDGSSFFGEIEALLEEFLALAPSDQFGVISGIYPAYLYYYPENGLALSPNGGASLFTYFLTCRYGQMSDEAFTVFANYLYALECYFNSNDDYSQSLFEEFETIVENHVFNSYYLNILSNEERQLLQGLYETCHQALSKARGTYTPEGERAQDFETLEKNIRLVSEASRFLEADMPVHSLLISSYEAAERAADKILQSGDENAVDYYTHRKVFDYDGTGLWTYEYAMYFCRNDYIYSLNYNAVSFERYASSALPAFLAKSAPVLWEGFTSLYHLDRKGELTEEQVGEVMAEFRNLSAEERQLFLYLDNTGELYYGGLRSFFGAEAEEDALNTLWEIETFFAIFEADPAAAEQDGTLLSDEIKADLDRLIEVFAGEKTGKFALLKEMFTFYRTRYEEIGARMSL